MDYVASDLNVVNEFLYYAFCQWEGAQSSWIVQILSGKKEWIGSPSYGKHPSDRLWYDICQNSSSSGSSLAAGTESDERNKKSNSWIVLLCQQAKTGRGSAHSEEEKG